jgi:hypothetical protein
MVELAAILLGNPNTRVGLAAKYRGTGVGLAAMVAELTGYIWIWQFRWCATVYAFTVCAWAESILTMPVGTYRFRIFFCSISAENRVSRFKRCSDHPNLTQPWGILPYTTPQQHMVWFELFVFWLTTLCNPMILNTFIWVQPMTF